VLKPGGVLKVAVPDYDKVHALYEAGAGAPIEAFLFGSQEDEYGAHLSMWNEGKLREALQTVGLVDIRGWSDDHGDCASYPISLNLQGTKPGADVDATPARSMQVKPERQGLPLRTKAVMSTPRLGFMDNFQCMFEACARLGIEVHRHTGAFWEQCITRAIEAVIADEEVECVLTVDYDTVFRPADVAELVRLLAEHDEAAAIAPIQASRTKRKMLFTMQGEDGKNLSAADRSTFDGPLTPIRTAHFGCTVLHADMLRTLPRPWFWSQPGADGRWGQDRVDADIYFWHQMAEAGFQLYQANRIAVGHAELMLQWPNLNMEILGQHPSEYWRDGKPEEVWR